MAKAAYNGNQELVSLLIDLRADLDYQLSGKRIPSEWLGCTAFNLARQRGHLEIANLLENAGANVEITPHDKPFTSTR